MSWQNRIINKINQLVSYSIFRNLIVFSFSLFLWCVVVGKLKARNLSDKPLRGSISSKFLLFSKGFSLNFWIFGVSFTLALRQSLLALWLPPHKLAMEETRNFLKCRVKPGRKLKKFRDKPITPSQIIAQMCARDNDFDTSSNKPIKCPWKKNGRGKSEKWGNK